MTKVVPFLVEDELMRLGATFSKVKNWSVHTVADGQLITGQNPVAVGVAAAGHGVALDAALPAFLQAVAANWVSAGVRLIPLGQSDGQRVLAALEPVVAATAQRALATALDDIGAAAFRADLAVARHETQYTRLFRS